MFVFFSKQTWPRSLVPACLLLDFSDFLPIFGQIWSVSQIEERKIHFYLYSATSKHKLAQGTLHSKVKILQYYKKKPNNSLWTTFSHSGQKKSSLFKVRNLQQDKARGRQPSASTCLGEGKKKRKVRNRQTTNMLGRLMVRVTAQRKRGKTERTKHKLQDREDTKLKTCNSDV